MQGILRGASISASGTALSLVVNLLIVTILVREFGLEAAGLVGLCNVFTAMGLLGVFDFGVPGALTRELSRIRDADEPSARALFCSALLAFMAIGVFFCLGLSASTGFLTETVFSIDGGAIGDFEKGLGLTAFALLFQFPSLILKAELRSRQAFVTLYAVTLLGDGIRLLALLVAVFFDYTYVLVFWGAAASSIIIMLLLLRRHINAMFAFRLGQIYLVNWGEFFGLAKHVFSQRISSVAYHNADRLAAGMLLGPVAVGAIEVFSKIPILFNKSLGIAVSAVVPTVSKLDHENDREILGQTYIAGLKFYYLLLIGPIGWCVFYAEWILTLWVNINDPLITLCLQLMLCWCLLVPLQFGGFFLLGLNKKLRVFTLIIAIQPIIKIIILLISLYFGYGLLAFPVSFLIAALTVFFMLPVIGRILHCSHVGVFFRLSMLGFGAISVLLLCDSLINIPLNFGFTGLVFIKFIPLLLMVGASLFLARRLSNSA